jgi:hypothetical protein
MSFVLFDKIRLYFKRANIYSHENILQNQSNVDKIYSNPNGLINLSDPSFYIEQSNVQINRLERMKDFDQMDEVGEMTLALDLYADECSLRDPERNHSVFVKTSSIRLKNEVEDFLYNVLNIDAQIRPIARYLAKYGDYACEVVPTANRDGVASIKTMFMYNFTRVETKYGDLVGFFYQLPGEQPVFYNPWQVSHIRLVNFEQLNLPYGRSVLDGARRDWRRLRLMEDAALVYRLTRSAEKRVFKVPVGNLPPKEREQYIQIIARRFKKQKFIDPATGAMNEKYAPHIQDDDYFIPVTADGAGVEIDTLKGAENLDAIADIEYFKKKMVSALKIPFNRVGLSQEGSDSSKTVAQQSPEFAKAIQWIQDQLIVGIKKIVLVHLALRGYGVDDMKNFELSMTSASAIDELYRIETWASRVDIMGGLKELKIFPDSWIVEKFTDLTKDELEVIKRTMEISSNKEESSEDEEDFFEDINIKKLVINEKKELLKDAVNRVNDSKIKFGPHASFNKLLNENEFDGIVHNNIELKSSVTDKDKVISEMKVFLASIDDELLLEDTTIKASDIIS